MIVGLNTWFSDIIFTSAFPDLELVSDQDWERLELGQENDRYSLSTFVRTKMVLFI